MPGRSVAYLAAAVGLLAVAVPGQAALVGTHPFALDAAWPAYGDEGATSVSARIVVEAPRAEGAFAFFDASFDLGNLSRVCWEFVDPTTGCTAENVNASLRVLGGSSFALWFPGAVAVQAEAAHAAGGVVDLGTHATLQDVGAGRVFAAVTIEGVLRFVSPVPAIAGVEVGPDFDPADHRDDVGALATFTDNATVEISVDGNPVFTVRGADRTIAFMGTPRPGPVAFDAFAVPFEGATAKLRPAAEGPAREGADACRLATLRARIAEAADEPSPGACEVPPDLAVLQAEILNGALVRVPGGLGEGAALGDVLVQGNFVRFTTLTMSGHENGTRYEGRAILHIAEGRVQDAPEVSGVSWLRLPWWGWALWVLALGFFVAKLVVRPSRNSARWDRHWWIGWASGAAALLLVVWLWDREVHALLGTSFFSTQASGAALGAIAAIEFVPLALVSSLLMAPLGSMARSIAMLAGQGRFMNLSIPVGTLGGFLLGVPLLRAFLDAILSQVPGMLGA